MDLSITTRSEIVEDARAAAQRFHATGVEQPNPYAGEPGREEVWQVAYRRHIADGEDCEASA